jgi:hypothetical protein
MPERQIFAKYLKSVFLPDVTKVRREKGIEQEEAALLLDNCPSHLASDMMDMFTAAKVRMVALTRIKTHLPTPRFGIICTSKRVGKHHMPFDDLTSTSRFIDRQG